MLTQQGRIARSQELPHVSLPDFPGILAAMKLSPDIEHCLRKLAHTLLVDPFPGSDLSRHEREMIATVVSAHNGCYYCGDSHGAFSVALLKKAGLGEEQASDVIDLLKSGSTEALDSEMTALLVVAKQVTEDPRGLTSEEIDSARSAGASDGDIQLTVLIASAFNMYNRMVDGLRAKTPAALEAFSSRAEEIAARGYMLPDSVPTTL